MSARCGLTEQAADAAIDQACCMLRLPTIRQHFPETADNSARHQQSYRAFLAELLMAECDDRARRRSERRIRAAAFPREKSLRTFDYAANPNLDPAVVNTLATCGWIRKGQPPRDGSPRLFCHFRVHPFNGADVHHKAFSSMTAS